MPKLEWLRSEWSAGYSSGSLANPHDPLRQEEELKVGGRFADVISQAIVPYVRDGANIIELGHGRGSWTRVLLDLVPNGTVHTLDFQDVTQWIDPADYGGRFVCHRGAAFDYGALPDGFFDFFYSFGVLCLNDASQRLAILKAALPKMRLDGWAVHQYGDWTKLDSFGWDNGGRPSRFKTMHDDRIWWPRNDADAMAETASLAG